MKGLSNTQQIITQHKTKNDHTQETGDRRRQDDKMTAQVS